MQRTAAPLLAFAALSLSAALPAFAQAPTPAAAPCWSPATYPDEGGFRRRVAPMVPTLAKIDIYKRSMARSTCPDTGLPVYTWAVEGEDVISPYTGRRYKQGDTGYFGPKERGADGRITAFGGDPLKQGLPPVLAKLLLNPADAEAKAYLSIPGNLRQHYHFAAANWARFYPLLSGVMGDDWRRDWADAVARYAEGRRPSDGPARENAKPLSHTHDLIGEPGELLGGRVQDGGTENHKTMWRTSGLLYAQWLGAKSPDAKVSGYPAAEAERLITPMLTGYLRTIFTVGNGEYDSSTYYPYSLRAYLNLYDFSPKPETRALAQAMLDYYVASYGLKVFNGTHAGAEKRGWAPGDAGSGATLGEMDSHLWVWQPAGVGVPVDGASLVTSIQQATTAYRPNRVIGDVLSKNVPLPFEAEMARPTYHSKDRNAFQESFYCAKGFALGSVAMTRVDNPTQQTVWSLVCRGKGRSLVFGGGQPRYRHPEGHSPYTQTLQKRGALVVLTAPTRPLPAGAKPDVESQQRQESAADKLAPLAPPADPNDPAALAAWWEKAPGSDATWLFLPRDGVTVRQTPAGVFVEAGDAFVAVRTLGGGAAPSLLRPSEAAVAALPDTLKTLRAFQILVVPGGTGGVSGYVLDATDRADFADLDTFARAVADRTNLDVAGLANPDAPKVAYTSLAGDRLEMTYRPAGLRAAGVINGKPVDWDRWAGGGVIASPYLTIKDGRMTVSDGREGYTVRLGAGDFPVWGKL